MPAAVARTSLVSAVTIGHLSRSLEAATKLGSLVSPLPLDAQSLLATLAQQMGVSPQAVERLDLTKAIAGLALGNGPQKDASWVLAIPARSPADAAALPAMLGTVEQQQGPVFRVKPAQAPAPVWALTSGATLVVSSDLDAAARGALLAVEGSATPSSLREGREDEDATVVIWPAAMAKEKNVDLRFAARLAVEQIAASMAENGTSLKAEQRVFLEKMADHLADSRQLELGLRLDESKGSTLQLRVVATPGSVLAGLVKDVHPATLDPAVLKGPTGIVAVLGDGTFYGDMYRAASARLAVQAAKDKGAAGGAKLLDAFLAAMAPGSSLTGGFEPSVSGLYVMNLKDAASAAALSEALLSTTKEALQAFGKDQDPVWVAVGPSITVKKESVGGQKVLHVGCSFKGAKAPTPRVKQTLALLDAIYGDKPSLWGTVQGQKLVAAMGDATAKQAFTKALSASAAPPPPPALQEALATASGRDAFFFADVRQIAGIVGRFKDARLDPKKIAAFRGLLTAPLPVWGSAWGDKEGRVYTFDLVLSRTLFENVGKMVPALVAMFAPR